MIKIVKTTGGSNGSPVKCNKCGSNDFIRAGEAWSCLKCALYFPKELPRANKPLSDDIKQLEACNKRLKDDLKRLEDLVKG